MKRLLIALVIFLPIYLFAQGFGSFSHDQPYLAKDNSSSSGTFVPVPGTALWWVFTNHITNAFVTNWTDQIQGKVLNQKSGGIITNTSDGVVFPNTSSEQWLSNTVTGGPFLTNNTFSAVGFILNFKKTQAANGGLYASGTISDFVYFSPFEGGGQNPWAIEDQIPGPDLKVGGYINTNLWQDLLIASYDSGGTRLDYYTNGVLSKTQLRGLHKLAVVGDFFSGSRVVMDIRDIIFITNVTSSTLSGVVSNWHHYKTNVYGP